VRQILQIDKTTFIRQKVDLLVVLTIHVVHWEGFFRF